MSRPVLNRFESAHLIDGAEQMSRLASVARDLDESDEAFRACGAHVYSVSFEEEADIPSVTLDLDLPHGICTADVDLGCVLTDENLREIYLLAKHYEGFSWRYVTFWGENEAGEMGWKPTYRLHMGYSIVMGSETPVPVCRHVSVVAQRSIASFRRVAHGEFAMDCIRRELNGFQMRDDAFAR